MVVTSPALFRISETPSIPLKTVENKFTIEIAVNEIFKTLTSIQLTRNRAKVSRDFAKGLYSFGLGSLSWLAHYCTSFCMLVMQYDALLLIPYPKTELISKFSRNSIARIVGFHLGSNILSFSIELVLKAIVKPSSLVMNEFICLVATFGGFPLYMKHLEILLSSLYSSPIQVSATISKTIMYSLYRLIALVVDQVSTRQIYLLMNANQPLKRSKTIKKRSKTTINASYTSISKLLLGSTISSLLLYPLKTYTMLYLSDRSPHFSFSGISFVFLGSLINFSVLELNSFLMKLAIKPFL